MTLPKRRVGRTISRRAVLSCLRPVSKAPGVQKERPWSSVSTPSLSSFVNLEVT